MFVCTKITASDRVHRLASDHMHRFVIWARFSIDVVCTNRWFAVSYKHHRIGPYASPRTFSFGKRTLSPLQSTIWAYGTNDRVCCSKERFPPTRVCSKWAQIRGNIPREHGLAHGRMSAQQESYQPPSRWLFVCGFPSGIHSMPAGGSVRRG